MKLTRKSQQSCSKRPKRTTLDHQISRTKKQTQSSKNQKYFLCLFPLCLPALSLIGFVFQMKLPESLDLLSSRTGPERDFGYSYDGIIGIEEQFRVHCQGLFDDTKSKKEGEADVMTSNNTYKFAPKLEPNRPTSCRFTHPRRIYG